MKPAGSRCPLTGRSSHRIANEDSVHALGVGMAPTFICLVLHRRIYDRCPMDFPQATRGRVLLAQASTGDLVAGEGGSHETAAIGLGCAAGPSETVLSPNSAQQS